MRAVWPEERISRATSATASARSRSFNNIEIDPLFVDDRRKAARGQDVGFLIELGGRTQLGEPLPVVGEQIGLELGPVAGLASFVHSLVAAGKGEGVGGGRTH